MPSITMTNSSARLLNYLLAQPDNMTKTSDILRAGRITAILEEQIPEQPTNTELETNAEALKTWSHAAFTLHDVTDKTRELMRTIVGKMAEKGKLGASHDVVSLLTALGFSDD